jgi:outer membrane protein OmpA-like peptidoglycan-associated protein
MITNIDNVSVGKDAHRHDRRGRAAARGLWEGAAEARAKLTQLQSDPRHGQPRAACDKDADAAVSIAEQPEADKSLASHRVYIADRKVEIAKAQAETSLSEDQRAALIAKRKTARLNSRTREADTARMATADAQAQTAELQRQIEALQGKVTDRGVVLTLGDVLFASGKADLKEGAAGPLISSSRSFASTQSYGRDRGHTDSVGSDDFNQALSQRRADSVRSIWCGRASTRHGSLPWVPEKVPRSARTSLRRAGSRIAAWRSSSAIRRCGQLTKCWT